MTEESNRKTNRKIDGFALTAHGPPLRNVNQQPITRTEKETALRSYLQEMRAVYVKSVFLYGGESVSAKEARAQCEAAESRLHSFQGGK